MKKKRLMKTTCFMMGLIGSVMGLISGLLMVFEFGETLLFRSISLVMFGAMLLFLALSAVGDQNKSKRAKLMILFFMLVLTYPDLPLFSPILELLVIPLASLLYWQRAKDLSLWILLLLSEIALAVCKTLSLWSGLPLSSLWLIGGALILVSFVRFMMIFRFYKRAQKEENIVS